MDKLISQMSCNIKETPFNPYACGGVIAGSKFFIATLSFEGRSMEVYQTVKPGSGPVTIQTVFSSLLQDVRTYIAHGDDLIDLKQSWDQRFDMRALETRATGFATLIGGDWFGQVIESLTSV
jgi:hypothetical protein